MNHDQVKINCAVTTRTPQALPFEQADCRKNFEAACKFAEKEINLELDSDGLYADVHTEYLYVWFEFGFKRAIATHAPRGIDKVNSAALQAVAAERFRQDQKWGGQAHDDEHSTAEFVQLIEEYAGWARVMAGMNSPEKAKRRLIQVAALAVAAAESIDRKNA